MNPIVIKTAYNIYAKNPPLYPWVFDNEALAIPEPFVRRGARQQKMSPREFYDTYARHHLRWDTIDGPAWRGDIGSYWIIEKIWLTDMELPPKFILDFECDSEMTFDRFTKKREQIVNRATLVRAFGENWVKRLEAYKFSLCEKARLAKERGADRIN